MIDKQEASMPATLEPSGGHVEHELFVMGGIVLLVMEMKLSLHQEKDCIAQVLLKLSCE